MRPPRRLHASQFLAAALIALAGLAGVAILDGAGGGSVAYADHNYEKGTSPGPLESAAARAVPLIPNATPLDITVNAVDVPEYCREGGRLGQIIQPYFADPTAPGFDRATCLGALEDGLHRSFSLQVQAGGTYLIWQEIMYASDFVGLQLGTLQVQPQIDQELHYFSTGSRNTESFERYGWDDHDHSEGRRHFEDTGELAKWGFDPARHEDLRLPEGARGQIWVIVADDVDRTWIIDVEAHVVPVRILERYGQTARADEPGITSMRFRVWVQRLDTVKDDLTVEERFDYPPADELTLERGATVFREFIVREADGGALASGVTVNLNPAGSCENPEPGRLRCSIPTADLTPGVREFRFGPAKHGDHSEETGGWPGFAFTLQERDIVTKAQVTLETGGKVDLVVFLQGAVENAFSIEFHAGDALTLESAQAVSFGVGATVGVGGGIKLGPVSPRAKAEIEGSFDIKAYQTRAVHLPDTRQDFQRLALGSFMAESLFKSTPILSPILLFLGDELKLAYRPYVSADEIGVTGSRTASGLLGVFTANRGGLAPFTYGIGGTANQVVSVGWQVDRGSNEQKIVFRATLGGSAVFRPNVWDTHFAGESIDFSGTGSVAITVAFAFRGSPSINALKSVTFTLSAGTTSGERVTGDQVQIVFDGLGLKQAGDTLLQGLTEMFDSASPTRFDLATLEQVFTTALRFVEADLTVTKTRGTGFSPSLAAGGDVQLGAKVAIEASSGAEWLLTVTETTQTWRLAKDESGVLALFQISDQPFEETDASEQQFTTIVTNMLGEAIEQLISGTTIGDWILEQFVAGEEVVLTTSSDRTETAELTLEGIEQTIADSVGQTLDEIELAIRLLAPQFLPDFIIPGSSQLLPDARGAANVSLNSQQADLLPFFASEFVQIIPLDVTIDPPARLDLSYLASPEDPQALQLFRFGDHGVWEALPTTIDEQRRVATAEVSRFGTFVVGIDLTPPEIVVIETPAGFTAVTADSGSGVDAASVALTVDGEAVAATYDPVLGIVRPEEPIADGATVVVTVADTAGNVATLEAIVEALPIEDTSLTVDLTLPPVVLPAAAEETATTTPAPGVAVDSTPTPSVIFAPGDDASSGGGSLTIILVLIVLAAAGGGGFYAYRRWGALLRPGD